MSKLTESLLKLTARRMDACPLGCTWIPWGTCKNDRRSGSRIRERAKIDARYVYFLRFSGLLTFILPSLTVSRWQIFELISQNRASASDAKCGRSCWEPRDGNKLMKFQIIRTRRSFFCYSTHNSPWCLSDQWIEFLHPRWSQSFALCNFATWWTTILLSTNLVSLSGICGTWIRLELSMLIQSLSAAEEMCTVCQFESDNWPTATGGEESIRR